MLRADNDFLQVNLNYSSGCSMFRSLFVAVAIAGGVAASVAGVVLPVTPDGRIAEPPYVFSRALGWNVYVSP
jgi:hypothetical protein